MAEHTPGPWEVSLFDEHPGDIRVCSIQDEGCVCCVALMGDWDDRAQVWTQETIEEWRANARLIAAAPDLREACEAMLARYATGYNANDAEAEMARAAIAKAKGEGDEANGG